MQVKAFYKLSSKDNERQTINLQGSLMHVCIAGTHTHTIGTTPSHHTHTEFSSNE